LEAAMRERDSTEGGRFEDISGAADVERPRLAVRGGGMARAGTHVLAGPVRGPLVGALVLLLALGVLAAVAVACEGTGGPPSSPPSSETVVSNPGEPGVKACYLGKSVDCASGNETEQQTDISIGGRGPGLHIVRSYNGLSAAEAKEAGPWGYGWTGSYDATIEVGTETVTVHQDNGSAVTFYKSGTEYTQGGWVQARLVKSGSNYIYTLPNQTKLEFNSEDRLVKETERNGNSNTLTYKEGKLEKVADGASRLLTFKYNGEGLVESVKDPMGHVVSYTYLSNQLASVTIEGKERWKFEYESPHLLKKLTDGRSHATTIKYEATTHRVTEEEVGGHVRKWSYGTKETTITEPNSSETVEVFNAAGEPTKITHAKGAGAETTTEYEYSGETFNLTKLLDGNKHEWKYGYDTEDNRTSETDPAKDEKKWTYDKKHDVETETTPEGEKTTYKLNSSGNPEATERPIGSETQKTEFKYDEKGDLTEVVDPLKNTTKYAYDTAGDKEAQTDGDGNEWTWKYNEDSQEISETTPKKEITEVEPNEQGRVKKITNPLEHTTEYKYDGNGNVELETDGNKHITKYEYNEENLRTKVEEPNKTVVETGYDAEGKMTSHTDGNKHIWEYKRNQLEQVTEEKSPTGKLTKKKYDKAGNLESLEDPEKHATEYTYDESNRPVKVKYSTGSPSEVTYEYNKDGKVTKMKDEAGTTENTWDKLDRLTEYKNGAGKTVKYEYNLDNEPTKITYPNEKSVTRGYDKDGKLEKVTDWNSRVTKFVYNFDAQLEYTEFPKTSEVEEEDHYIYNKAGRIFELKMIKNSATLVNIIYKRDGDEQITKTTYTGLPGSGVEEDAYDENNRLTEAEGKKYEYDKANNPTKIEGAGGYSYNEADQLKEGPEVKYSYNEDGQRTETKPTKGPTTTYSYNQAGNLTTVKRPKEEPLAEINDSYTYDGTNLRQTQTINGTKTNLTWDTAEELPLILTDETNSYIYGAENFPIEQIPSSGETLYLHHDQQGSTRLLSNTKGEAVAAYTYSPYGSLTASTGTGSTPLRYDGQYTNTDTGLVYLRSRVYDPQTAQFLTIDPALPTTGEPYAYTKDNPLNYADPAGEWWSWAQWRWVGQTAAGTGIVLAAIGVVTIGVIGWVPIVGTTAIWIGVTYLAVGVPLILGGFVTYLVTGGQPQKFDPFPPWVIKEEAGSSQSTKAGTYCTASWWSPWWW
jgi:RHS repeat-associated protein